MSADAVAVLIRQKHVVGTDGDEPGVTDFHFVVKLDQTLCLPPILWAVPSPAEHQDHRIWPLKIGKLPTFARVIGQLIIGKYCASYNVRSHVVEPPPRQCAVSAFIGHSHRSRTCGRTLADHSLIALVWPRLGSHPNARSERHL